MELLEKKEKDGKDVGKLFRKNLKIKCAYLLQTYTVDIDIHMTSRNGGRKIMQFIRITSGTATRVTKMNQFSQFS